MATVEEFQDDVNRIADKVWHDSPYLSYTEALREAEQTVRSWGVY
jgi:hypothetical protein